MPSLGLKNSVKSSVLSTPGIIRDNLILKHDYNARSVVPVSDGAAYFGGAGTNNRIAINSTEFGEDGEHVSNHTFAFWAKRNTIGSVHHTILGRSSSSSYSHIRLSSDNYLKFETDTNGDTSTTTLHTIDTNWHHYALVVTNLGATVTSYQDGVICSESGAVNDDSITFNEIGCANSGSGGSNEMDGYICNLGIWTSALTQAQVKSIMNKNYAGLTDSEKTNLVSWWNLSANANDSHGSNNGTLS